MSLTIALLDNSPERENDDVVFVQVDTGDEFVLGDDMLAMIDRLVGTGFGTTRAEVIKGVLEHSLRRHESIGRCELCGLVDHHLIKGVCPVCRDRFRPESPRP